jgi:sialate O-acetylesterase
MKLDKIFTSNMVFAAGKPIRIYGDGNGTAEVCFAGMSKTESFFGDSWLIELPPVGYGGPYELKATLGGEEHILTDVYVGEVYIFAGQSNMQFKMHESNTDPKTCFANSKIRLFSTDRIEQGDRYKASDGWVVCDRDNIKDFSAIAYLVSNEISVENNVAVGAIACYQGASVIHSWVPKGAFQKIGIDIPSDKKSADCLNEYFGRWNGDGQLYEYSFLQIAPFSVSGVIWYQGESDAYPEESKVYGEMLAEMIRIWRADLRDEKLQFIIVQIADFQPRFDDMWKAVQRAQAEAEKRIENVKTVRCADVCETDDIHPKTKDKLSHRIAGSIKLNS